MKKYLGKTWAKVLAMIILILAVLMTLSGAFLLFISTELGEEGLKKNFYTVCCDTYSAWLFSQEGGITKDPALLEGGNMQYAIAECEDGDPHKLDMSNPDVFLYKSPGYSDYMGFFMGYDGFNYSFRTDSFINAWLYGVRIDDERHISSSVEDKYYVVFYNVRDPLLNADQYSDLFTEAKTCADTIIHISHHGSVPLMIGGVILSILCFFWLLKSAGRRAEDDQIHTRMADRIPYGLYLSGVFILEGMGLALGYECIREAGFASGYIVYTVIFGSMGLAIMAGMIIMGMLFIMSTAVRIKSKTFIRYTVCHYLKKGFIKFRNAVNVHTSLMVKSIVLISILTLLQLFVIIVTEFDLALEVFAFFVYKCVEIPVFIYIIYQFAKILRGTKAIAEGNADTVIDTHRMFWDMKGHAEDINNIGSGIGAAVEARMKSERMKTELITNVSHDIKTPLTSIINYVDLLEKEQLESEKAREYVEVLSRQSARLKKLIGDLMDASKASTGNIEMHMEPCDLSVILTQAMGEFEERLSDSNLELVMTKPEASLFAMADGRQLWRVFENLLSNICKYAMPGTRVYADLKTDGEDALIILKNISASPLNFSGDELTERFVRGDTSRSTEGSGLGLSISESLCRLMNGKLQIDIDGDLFKVTVRMKKL